MKGIKKTLMAGALACATLNAQAAEVENPFSFGLNVGTSGSPVASYSNEAKINGKKVDHSALDGLWVYGNLYGEYAITNYIGTGLAPGYRKQAVTLKAEKAEGETGESSIHVASHGIDIPLYLSIYPLGYRAVDGDTFKINLGPAFYLPLSRTYKKDGKKIDLTEEQKKHQVGWDIAGRIDVKYEFNCGVSAGIAYSYWFKNRLSKEKNDKQNPLGKVDLDHATVHTADITLGYNFASLFSDESGSRGA